MGRMGRKDRGQRIRVDFRPNRQERRRSDEWTQRYATGDERLDDTVRGEMVRAKGSLSRRRTIVVDADQLPAVDERQWRQGVVTHVYGLTCGVADAAGGVWECTVRRVLRTIMIGQRSGITCGDRIWFADLRLWLPPRSPCTPQPIQEWPVLSESTPSSPSRAFSLNRVASGPTGRPGDDEVGGGAAESGR